MRIKETVPVGEVPPIGHVPPRMLAQVVRQSRFGDPRESFQVEEIDTPSPGPGQVLIAVMAAGVNFNNVWAARGQPIDVIAVERHGLPRQRGCSRHALRPRRRRRDRPAARRKALTGRPTKVVLTKIASHELAASSGSARSRAEALDTGRQLLVKPRSNLAR